MALKTRYQKDLFLGITPWENRLADTESAKNRGVWRPPRHQDDVAFGQVASRRMRSCQISTSFASCYAMSAP